MIYNYQRKGPNLEINEFFDYSNLFVKKEIDDTEYFKILIEFNKIQKEKFPLKIKIPLLKALRYVLTKSFIQLSYILIFKKRQSSICDKKTAELKKNKRSNIFLIIFCLEH